MTGAQMFQIFSAGFGCREWIDRNRGSGYSTINPFDARLPTVDEDNPLQGVHAALEEVNESMEDLTRAFSTIRKKRVVAALKEDVASLQAALKDFEKTL